MSTETKTRPSHVSKWDMSMCFIIYDLAKAGESEASIAGALGIHVTTLDKWKRKFSSCKMALEKGRAIFKAKDDGNYFDFIAGRLEPELRELWNELLEADDDPNAINRLETLIALHGPQARQRLFLHAMIHFNFDVSRSCRFVNISRTTYTRWKLNDSEFCRLIDEVLSIKGDFYEQALVKLVRTGCVPAIIHANKTYNAKRGYSTKVDVTVNGSIDVNVRTLPIKDLELPLDIRVALLDAMKERKLELAKQDAGAKVEVIQPHITMVDGGDDDE